MSRLGAKRKADDDDDDDALYERLKASSSVIDDLLVAVYEVRLVAPFAMLAVLLLAYHLLLAPYQVEVEQPNAQSVELHKLRPVLSPQQQGVIRETVFWSETSVWLADNPSEVISLAFQRTVDGHGAYYLPDFFYEGVVVGVTATNSHGLEFTAQSKLTLEELRQDLLHTIPKPTQVFRSVIRNSGAGWQEESLAAHYSYRDLERQGMLSSDSDRPFKRLLPKVLEVARRYKQIYVTVYYPHTFGHLTDAEKDAKNQRSDGLPEVPSRYSSLRPQYKYTNIIREVVPTRTGLDLIKSSTVVWLTKVNHEEPHLSDAGHLASVVYKRDASPL